MGFSLLKPTTVQTNDCVNVVVLPFDWLRLLHVNVWFNPVLVWTATRLLVTSGLNENIEVEGQIPLEQFYVLTCHVCLMSTKVVMALD